MRRCVPISLSRQSPCLDRLFPLLTPCRTHREFKQLPRRNDAPCSGLLSWHPSSCLIVLRLWSIEWFDRMVRWDDSNGLPLLTGAGDERSVGAADVGTEASVTFYDDVPELDAVRKIRVSEGDGGTPSLP